jgi:hypothetical protein
MKHQTSNVRALRVIRRTTLACVPAALLGSACGGEPLSLGHNDAAINAPACGIDVSGDVRAETQEQVDALAGCEEIGGFLHIEGAAPLDLTPLNALRFVHGTLSLFGLDSLAGLEGVERVSGVNLRDLSVADLTPLANLTSADAVPRAERLLRENGQSASGGLTVLRCNALKDLSGLENVNDWTHFDIGGNESLTSLDGVTVPPVLGQLSLSQNPALTDVSALSTLEDVDSFDITAVGIQSFGDLLLETADEVSLIGNPALTDLDGLARLATVRSLRIEDNDSLIRIDLPALGISVNTLDEVWITGNAVLPAVPPLRGGQGQAFSLDTGIEGRSTLFFPGEVFFVVADNDQLAQVATPSGFDNIQQVAIFQNPRLTQLDFGNLERADNLLIATNPELASVSAARLERVGDLDIVDNPALSVAPFADVQAFTREITGNLDAP